MLALIVRFQVRPDRIDEFDALVRVTLAGIAAHEPGTLIYLPTRVEGDDAARIFVEVYADEAAFAAHEEQPHVRHFLRERAPMLESVRVERLHDLDDPVTRAEEPGVRA